MKGNLFQGCMAGKNIAYAAVVMQNCPASHGVKEKARKGGKKLEAELVLIGNYGAAFQAWDKFRG